MKTTIALAALLLACGAAGAQQVWRCGSTYSQQPCPGGTQVQADDGRSTAQAAQTRAAARSDAKAANAMEKARLAHEAKAAPAMVMPVPARQEVTPPPEPVMTKPLRAKKRAAKQEYFTAVAPRQPGDAAPRKKKSKRKSG